MHWYNEDKQTRLQMLTAASRSLEQWVQDDMLPILVKMME